VTGDILIAIPVIFLWDRCVVANGPDLAQGLSETEQAERRRVEQKLEDGGCVVVKRETGEGDSDEETERKADPTRDEARPRTI